MGERKGTNHYYPPDFDPKKHGSLNGYHGVHALRERARKLDRGILIIRFEMPYNVWCLGCGNHIGMGVRYNAEKTKTGQYYSTPIYKFRMKCHLCDNHFEMQTDPANFEYVIISGLKRKEQRWNPDENEQVAPEEKKKHRKLESDPMFKLEHGKQDVEKAKKTMPSLSELAELREDWIDDFALNQASRRKFREEKKDLLEKKKEGDALLEKSCLPKDMPLVDESEEDRKLATLIKYKSVESYDERQARKRKAIEEASVFPSTESYDADQSPLKKLKASFVSPSLAGQAHFAKSMSGFGVVVRKKSSLSKPNHSPEEPAKVSRTTEKEGDGSGEVDSKPVESRQEDSSKKSTSFSETVDGKSEPKTEISLAPASINDLPNPFKNSQESNDKQKNTDSDGAESEDDEAGPSQGVSQSLIGLQDEPPTTGGNSLSLLSGMYDGSSSENESDT